MLPILFLRHLLPLRTKAAISTDNIILCILPNYIPSLLETKPQVLYCADLNPELPSKHH